MYTFSTYTQILQYLVITLTYTPTSVAQVLDSTHADSFVEIDHKIFSTVILSLRLIQKGQLSVSGERRCKIQVNLLED